MSGPATLTKAEVCELLRISPATLDRRVKAGLIPTVNLGGRVVRFPAAAIARLCDTGSAA